MTHFIDFQPIGRRGECPEGYSILECARHLGVDLVNVCGGNGSCGSCLIQLLDGTVSPVDGSELDHITDDDLKLGYRLACYAIPGSDCKVRVPPESLAAQQRTQIEGQESQVELSPAAKTYILDVAAPSIADLRSDTTRLAAAIQKQHQIGDLSFDFSLLGSLSSILRENRWRVKAVVYNDEVIAVFPQEQNSLGVAIDLGSTKIAFYLIDLETGGTVASKGLMNPQIAYGEDIMTRMTAVQADSKAAEQFQSLIIEAINETVAELCQVSAQLQDQIVNMVVVGNTAMHHLFLGFPVRQLGQAPYVPEVVSPLDIKARDLGINMAKGGYVHLLPNIAGYVGADHVAMLMASGIQDKPGVVLAIDIGTNTEICLSNRGSMASLSTASGPAFEGAHIKYGMRAAPGAIERFQIIDGKNTFQTIGNAPAIGLCGSGILDVLAQLRLADIVNRRGRMMEHPQVRGAGKNREYIIASGQGNGAEITFSQKDIEQLQLAKGAIRTGIDVLLSRQGLSAEDIDEIIIAGAFGTYLDVKSAITIGMLPDVPIKRVRQVGNAAGIGAKQALLSSQKREEAKRLAEKIEYIELAGDPDFMNLFAQALFLG